jgi:GDP-4-dehydro-6-deoxy-D-mannose reductase
MKSILVTGSEGFVGSHFIKALKETLYKIVPVCHPLLVPRRGRYVTLDITNAESTREVMKAYKPDIVFHLAAVSSVARSFSDRPLTYGTNIMGTLHLLEGAEQLDKPVRFYFVSTCEVYGGGENLTEAAPIALKNPYAISKYAAELICRDYGFDNIGWIILRPFNHTGPGQADNFVLPTIARQVVEIEKGKRPPLVEIGNTEITREFMNIGDIVNAYKLSIEKCQVQEIYNIACGKGHTLGQAIQILQAVSKKKFEVKVDAAKLRKVDIAVLTGNGEKFSRTTGWHPKVMFEKTLEDLLNYWRAQIK